MAKNKTQNINKPPEQGNQSDALVMLLKQMREIAIKKGTMHSYWETIFDVEAFLKNKKTILVMTTDGWIKYIKDLLKV